MRPTYSDSGRRKPDGRETRQPAREDLYGEETLRITGRHDPCIIPRAIPVLEACAMIAVYDAWKEAGLE